MTDLKRVVVYLTEEDRDQITAIAKTLGQSRSAFCGSIIKESIPHMAKVAEAVNLAKTDPEAALKFMRDFGYDTQMSFIEEMKGLEK